MCGGPKVTFDANDVVRRLGARLKMRHLMLLLQIQQHGSLTRVAEHMASSQPAVTNALSELESMFGTPLFERSSRGCGRPRSARSCWSARRRC
jgi:molybdenum-dependent DNA-binding transcriptional regulator ModE